MSLLLSATTSFAEPDSMDERLRDEVRELAYDGVEAYIAQDYTTASDKLESSFRLLQVPSLGLWSARTLVHLGKLVEALDRYRATVAMQVSASDPPVQAHAKRDAARELQELLPRIPTLSLRLDAAPLDEVEVDGRALSRDEFGRPQQVNPGRHVVSAKRGSDRTQAIVDILENSHEEVWLRFEPIAPQPQRPAPLADVTDERGDGASSALRTGGWVALGAGGACVATGALAYAVGRSKYSDFERRDLCSNQSCSGRRDRLLQHVAQRIRREPDIRRGSRCAGSWPAARHAGHLRRRGPPALDVALRSNVGVVARKVLTTFDGARVRLSRAPAGLVR